MGKSVVEQMQRSQGSTHLGMNNRLKVVFENECG